MGPPGPLLDLALAWMATYGVAWVLVKSRVFASPRAGITAHMPILGALLGCIVCTGTWVMAGIVILSPWISVFSPWIHPRGVLDVLVLCATWIAVGWAAALRLGDAD